MTKISEIIANDCIYADKTRYIYDLLRLNYPFFLSRPSRFGKTLLVDTLEAILRGQRDLFKGLWIGGSDYNWAPKPVIRLNINEVTTESLETVENGLSHAIASIAESEGVLLGNYPPSSLFLLLIHRLQAKYGRNVAVLIDDYDKPILDNIGKPELAGAIRETLMHFYGILKAVTGRGFTFITGVTEFTQTSIFSELNDLFHLTLDEEYSNICGFTVNDLDYLFPEYMEMALAKLKSDDVLPDEAEMADLRKLILDWYGGYSWDGETRVFNPWSILHFFENERFDDYWSETGVSSFIANLVKTGKFSLRDIIPDYPITRSSNRFELGEDLKPVPFLFQAGYLTVDRVDETGGTSVYYLRYPNLEVKAAIVPVLMGLEPIATPLVALRQCQAMRDALVALDADKFQESFGSFLAGYARSLHEPHVPHDAYCHRQFISAMRFAGCEIDSEGSVGDGKFDAHWKASDQLEFVFEIKYVSQKTDKGHESTERQLKNKMVAAAKTAMKQIEKKGYAKKYKVAASHRQPGGLPGAQIYKAALVVGGRVNVLIQFKKEDYLG
ncbi:MAG: ATP-binding protein [Deltaproteobacteria bacterium]|nr:ATP-binding protein [Deltaproteobacteria bacterium]